MSQNINNGLALETIKIISNDNQSSNLWEPVKGDETFKLLDHLKFPPKDRETLEEESRAVLAHCVPPSTHEGKETGLVIGYIQSGKTTSFTTVAALASDNDYRLIIVITGITTNLFNQSSNRLEKDLRIKNRTDRKWQFLSNPKARADIKQRIANAIQKKTSLPGIGKPTVLITVMKQRTHLNNLIKLLSELPLNGVPTLIIDDEADQASLNNLVNKGKESPTYKRILKIKSLLSHHSFLQYTATPQAPLLINIIDVLSPNFAALLTPGPAYTGGKIFFEGDFRLIRRIRESEVPSKDQQLTEPPDSLLQAMQIYFLGAAAGLKCGAQGNRSMMVHPSKETMQHANYDRWVRDIQQLWSQIFQLDKSDYDRKDLVNMFRDAYNDLSATVQDLASFDDLLEYLPHAISDTIVTMVNAAGGKTPQPDWEQNYSHILVGGEVLNRGYTIEGLTVSYMPRSKGVGNADTIQQRARWFGYKADYLGYCRVYLTDEQQEIYKKYVNSEEAVRRKLREIAVSGKSLNEWRRAFPLPPGLRPTRHDVIDREYNRHNYSHEWFEQQWPHASFEAVEINRVIVKQVISDLSPYFKVEAGITEMQNHLVASGIDLTSVYEELLTKFQITEHDESYNYDALLQQIDDYLQRPERKVNKCTVYLMSGGRQRRRSIDEEGKIPFVFQGPTRGKTGERYQGDSKFYSQDEVTIQIHIINISKDDKVITENVPTIAVRLPEEMSESWIIQTDRKASKKFARPNWE
ncbi:Z1 domain-containing protein [Dictyobacter aurantiacus]|uniref:Putative endonuclease Z1 domain-containing protein n=1 Tax=Dictyobacter aurantiacus TaxID=1936993 RepID=A0A401ZFS7_9CHLR|nr:Z1 domain-containing protein [Dictyobacter aurantiacus]GCE05750.1 hypothetical protein KDAU_30790 [Dictyobacter aurantiacus]